MSTEGDSYVPVLNLPISAVVEEVRASFKNCFGGKPEFYVRVPGRVNLIGEHIDYCGYGVCPMALEQDILLGVAVNPKQTKLRLYNLNPKYEGVELDINDFKIEACNSGPSWHEYFLCGLKGILDILPKGTEIKGMDIVLTGTIPPCAGLSSSSALVSAAALATSYALDYRISKESIARVCAECERYIGTQGGGMDQAIGFLAKEGCAKFIEFCPLRSTDVTLPEGAVFVIAHSLAELNKAATSDFNCRVVECRLAAQVIANNRGLDWRSVKKLGQLHEMLHVDLPEMISIVKNTLHDDSYTKDEIKNILSVTSDDLNETSLTKNTSHICSFKLKQRALHVFQEALRVQKFVAVCNKGGGEAILQTLGQLMSESHVSLRDLYECSHPQLDRLVDMSRDFALGARLTGAGWGGCIVALVAPGNISKYVTTLKEKFYRELGQEENYKKLVFATSPKGGACVFLEMSL